MLADLYALAVILFSMYTGKKPFDKRDADDLAFMSFVTLDYTAFWRLHEQAMGGQEISADFKDLMTSMLSFQPYQRLMLTDIVAHPFFDQSSITITKELASIEMSKRIQTSGDLKRIISLISLDGTEFVNEIDENAENADLG